MRAVVVVQVKNSFGYLPAFIAHHQRLVDKIIIIDHNSDRQLSGLARDGIEVFRVSAGLFAQELYAAYFLKKLDLKREFDFLFLLDADEFLPFKAKADLSTFMEQHRGTAVTSMRWRNGFPASAGPLDGQGKLYFTTWRSSTRKLIYNLRRLRDILPVMGNHNAKYPLADSLLVQIRPMRTDSGLGLLHIPFLGLEGLRQKLSEFPTQSYRTKIMRDLGALGISCNLATPELELSDQDLMSFVANYRTRATDLVANVDRSSFKPASFLDGLQDDISNLAADLARCPPAPVAHGFAGEAELVNRLRRNRVLVNRRLARAFGMQPDGTYAFHAPGEDVSAFQPAVQRYDAQHTMG
ncbi:hypothetical protein J2T08_003604 [Neorhizobium galegae]|uniref:glycosyltransferase family 2 protein n=1 Tax=Neorhizobium galegae TaxID=399 RepID=UPI00278AD236|nr:glycosyltransferase family 2 protein [Neorhizobium galegae]MDQ0135683.1 hypothetical protein [Neorhizobium galegae]